MEDKRNTEVEFFWKSLEEEIGGKVTARALGEYVSGYEDWPSSCWGIFFTTDAALYFKHFKQENWLSAMVNLSGKFGKGDQDREFSIRRSSIVRVERRTPPPAFIRWLLKPDPEIVVAYRVPDGRELKLVVRVVQDPEAFAAALS